MKKIKKLLAAALSVSLVLSATPLAFATEALPVSDAPAEQVAESDKSEEDAIATVGFGDEQSPTIGAYDAAFTTLSNGLSLVAGDVVNGATVSGDVSIALNGAVTIKNTVSIPKGASLAITGSGTLKRDASFTGRMFSVEGGTLTINGPGISIDGGAVWSSAEVADSTREKLTVSFGSSSASAAIYVCDNGTANLDSITMENLYTAATPVAGEKVQAPAIHVTGDSGAKADELHSTVNMTDVVVQKCATMSSQAIALFNDCLANLSGCKFLNNYSGGTYAGTLKAGGSTYFSQLNMTNCEASGNYSSGWGGVLLWAANSSCGSKSSKAIVDGCTFTGNKARYLGGAISNEAVMEVKNTTIKNNTAMAGGGIATFPFTLTETHVGGGNACGLTLGGGNVIQYNTAFASGDFTPFEYQDADPGKTIERGGATVETYKEDAAISDDAAIASPITYTGGGGGVWCYMNKPGWTCSLVIGNGNNVLSNTAFNVGGGVYVHNVASAGTDLSITGANISMNKAPNGGGVAVKDATVAIESGAISSNSATNNDGGIYVDNGVCAVLGTGSVDGNTAANGGGVYVAGGSSLTVSGGTITENRAVGVPASGSLTNGTVGADASNCGVGGGVYVANGASESDKSEFTMTAGEDSSVALYGNYAAFAASDAYASGVNTRLTLPEVDGMALSQGYSTAIGWFADYFGAGEYDGFEYGDSEYPSERLDSSTNTGRYDTSKTANVRVKKNLSEEGGFMCLTLGLRYSLVIEKRLEQAASEDQLFTFEIARKGADGGCEPYMTATVLIPAGETRGQTTLGGIPTGYYSVAETAWGFRCGQVLADGENPVKTVSIGGSDGGASDEVKITNTLIEERWLSGDCYAANVFSAPQDETEN